MPEFLHLIPPAEALDRLLQAVPRGAGNAEEVETAKALGRVTAEEVVAPHPLPEFPRSTVDGYAVRARDTHGATDALPAYLRLTGEVRMGAPADIQVETGTCALIHTGGMMPAGADAVVMVEHTQAAGSDEVEICRPAGVGENVIQAGEDVAPGDVVIPAGVRLRAPEIGGLMALGLTRVSVAPRPRVAILSTGDEVVPPGQAPKPGQVRDVNTYTLDALVAQAGGVAVSFGIFADREDALRAGAQRALAECDALLITAGSSASARDLTAQVIQALGEPGVLVHGVNVRPGRPTILGVCGGKPAIGLPGNPVSSLSVARLLVVPVVEALSGLRPRRWRARVSARLTLNLASQSGREDWVPVRLIRQEDGGLLAEPVFGKSNLIFTLVRADGFVCIPADDTGLANGSRVAVEMLE